MLADNNRIEHAARLAMGDCFATPTAGVPSRAPAWIRMAVFAAVALPVTASAALLFL